MSIDPKVKNLADLFTLVKNYSDRGWYFRGLSASTHELIPRAWRSPFTADQEKQMYRHFRRECTAYVSGHVPKNHWEWLALAQHHGLPTRLMDWSENLLVAAYFACAGDYSLDGAIYALNCRPRKGKSAPCGSPFKVKRVEIYRPPHVTRRITAQRGVFTVQPERGPMAGNPGKHTLEKIVVLRDHKPSLLVDLSRFGFNAARLFPDLDGLCEHVAWRFSTKDIATSGV